MNQEQLKQKIRNVPDFPKKGIVFRDITTLVQDGPAFKAVNDHLHDRYKDKNLDAVLGIESRGFIFGGALADRLGIGFIPARKPGKLPAETISESYDLEYGQATLEIHKDSITKGMKVLVVDDLLATGGTLEATAKLVERLGGEVAEIWVMIELSFLGGMSKIAKFPYFSLIQYDSE
ncbi:MAG: adenine phosphoribosyltransferase [candidate division Zixibacteria bacterium]|nr:adenine phosphoribosyltransferase [candidate division Zixibacteria bacterium]